MAKKEMIYTEIILKRLDDVYGEVQAFLYHNTGFQLLIAAILSAQTTDNTVNNVTPDLFSRYPDSRSLSLARLDDVEICIKKVNYYRTKAKNIIEASKRIEEVYKGSLPDNIDDLITLPGVGRKVANVVIADFFKHSVGVVVDTHVKRVSKRIGWTVSTNPKKIELDLLEIWSEKYYINTPKQLILIGRKFCFSRKPNCIDCPLTDLCKKNI